MFGRRQSGHVVPLREGSSSTPAGQPVVAADERPEPAPRPAAAQPEAAAPKPEPTTATDKPATPMKGSEPAPSKAAAGAPPKRRNANAALAKSKAMQAVVEIARPMVEERLNPAAALRTPRRELAREVGEVVKEVCADGIHTLDEDEERDSITVLLNGFLTEAKDNLRAERGDAAGTLTVTDVIDEAKQKLQPILLSRIDVAKASALPRAELAAQITEVVAEILGEEKMNLNLVEQRDLVTRLLNDMLGLGPLEALLADESVTDVMVNGAKQVYVERGGKLTLTDVNFRDDAHVMNVATRIVTRIGRRVDESTPLVDARLEDGSRVNIIIPPLAIDSPSISIRKFAKKKITLEAMEANRNLSPEMATVLKIASRCRLNILISGGTGSGKTTLLNALSRMIDTDERVVTIEDAAELQLQQPHVVRLETRPPNLEGQGEITQRELVKNTLRMRPDRIILGEIRGAEALDMLQAMNTGHDGSMCTIPRQPAARSPDPVGEHGRHGRRQASQRGRTVADRRGRQHGGPGRAYARRRPPDHPRDRSGGHGRRSGHHPGPVHLRVRGRGRGRQALRYLQVLRPASAFHVSGRLFRARSRTDGSGVVRCR